MNTLTTKQLKEKAQRQAAFELINVLPRDHFEKAHIPGSRNIPLSNDGFVQEVRNTVDNEREEIVVYCANRECDLSPKAARKLEDAGFTNVYDYEGGTKAWKDAGLPLKGEQEGL